MDKALEQATNGYLNTVTEGGIHPISKDDAEIFSELFLIVKKLGAKKELMKILEFYKKAPDGDLRDLLVTFNSTFEGVVENTVQYIEIGSESTLKVSLISSFTKHSQYDIREMEVVYKIIVNKSSNNMIPYANTEINFLSEKQRDLEYIAVKNKLKEFSNIKFL